MARSERGASPQRAGTNERRSQLPFCLAPSRVALILALAGVARLAEIPADIGTVLRRLGQRQNPQQRGPLQYFNSLLAWSQSGELVLRYQDAYPTLRHGSMWAKNNGGLLAHSSRSSAELFRFDHWRTGGALRCP